jgi:predicted GNAT family N-acyltransferase
MRVDYTIKPVETERIKELRFQVLWPHLSGPNECVIDPDKEEETFHMAAILNEEIIGTSTVIIDKNNAFPQADQYRLRAMATAPKVRGKGVGEKIIQAIISELKKRKCEILWCDARLTATGFYEKLGFKTEGKVYEVPNIGPHKLMYIEL